MKSDLKIDQYQTDLRTRAKFLLNESMQNGGLAEVFDAKRGWNRDIQAVASRPLAPLNEQRLTELTAILLSNARRYNPVTETTRAEMVSGFQDYLFPLIRASIPQNPVLDWVSVQPMTRKQGSIFFQNIKYGNSKGRIAMGGRVFDALTGFAGGYNYSNEFVEDETFGTGNGSAVTFSKTLDYSPSAGGDGGGIRPGTVVLKWTQSDGVTAALARDNGNGAFVLDTGTEGFATDAASGINYGTGLASVKFATAPTGPVLISYEYDSEGSSNTPQIDLDITVLPIVAQKRAMRYRFTLEAAMDLKAELGQDLEEIQASHVIGLITAEQARNVIDDLWQCAGAPVASFNVNYGSNPNISNRSYAADFARPLSVAANQMLRETQRFQPNWMIVDTAAKGVLDLIGPPHYAAWQQAPVSNEMGVQFVGVWNNQIRVYCDTLLDQQPGASPHGNVLMGHKAADDLSAGYIWAPYVTLYQSPSVTLDDMVTRKAFASRIGRKVVNPRLFKRVELVYS